MNYWIIPGNQKRFRITDYFRDHDIVDWKQSHYQFGVGDIVFIYVSSPISSIRYMLEVLERDIPYEESADDSLYWTDKHPTIKEAKHYRYVRLKLLKSSTSSALHVGRLVDFGFKAPQGPIRKLSAELIQHLLEQFS